MDNTSLCKLIREALHSPEKAEALALAIDQIPEIKTYLGKGYLPYYDEALIVTMREVMRNINRFYQHYPLNLGIINCQNPAETANVRQRFINWVIMILKCDCLDVKRKRDRDKYPKIISINSQIRGDDSRTIEETIDNTRTLDILSIPTLEGLDGLIAQEELVENEKKQVLIVHLIIDNLKQFTKKLNSLLEDSSSCHPRGNPQANCYELITRRILKYPPQRWEDIAEELQILYGTVTSHWKRKCEPLLKQIEQSLES